MEKKTINDIADLLNEIRNPQTETEIAEENREELEEASEISKNDIAPSDMARIKTLEKLFSASFEGFHEGGHGSIVDMTSKKPFHSVSRTQASEWLAISKQINKLKIRWIEIDGNRVSVGLESINEYDY